MKRFICIGFGCLGLISCGSEVSGNQTSKDPTPSAPNSRPSQNGTNEGVKKEFQVKGSWSFQIGSASQVQALYGSGSRDQEVTATVAPEVRFSIDNSEFKEPENPSDGVLSFGSLSVNKLRDNNLKSCGSDGKSRCTEAILRVYTSGTPGSGLWNTTDGYGLPIDSLGNSIGLGPLNAYVAKEIAIPTRKRVIRLRDFDAGGKVSVPLSVDFTEAGAGEFAATLTIEYAAR